MNDDKRAQICEVGFAKVADLTIKDFPGVNTISVSGSFNWLKHQSVEWSEEQQDAGGYVEQELKAVFTETSDTQTQTMRDYINMEMLIAMKYTNGEIRISGTNDNPITPVITISGSPRTIKVSFKHKSAEFAKLLKSF